MTHRTVLVICIGNVARGDDGVAHEVARLLTSSLAPKPARVVTAVDLDVAMALDVAESSLFVLVDAERRGDPPVRIEPLRPATPSSATGHGIDPGGLMMLAHSLYGTVPDAYVVSVAAPEMGHGSELSQAARTASEEAVTAVTSLISRFDAGPQATS